MELTQEQFDKIISAINSLGDTMDKRFNSIETRLDNIENIISKINNAKVEVKYIDLPHKTNFEQF